MLYIPAHFQLALYSRILVGLVDNHGFLVEETLVEFHLLLQLLLLLSLLPLRLLLHLSQLLAFSLGGDRVVHDTLVHDDCLVQSRLPLVVLQLGKEQELLVLAKDLDELGRVRLELLSLVDFLVFVGCCLGFLLLLFKLPGLLLLLLPLFLLPPLLLLPLFLLFEFLSQTECLSSQRSLLPKLLKINFL